MLCKRGVLWKTKTIEFSAWLVSRTAQKMENIARGMYSRFTIKERGKERDISAPQIDDRAVDKLITNEIIKPIYTKHSIYDNGASTVNKGFHFAMRRAKKLLIEHYKKYGREGGILLLDIKGYFPNAEHSKIKDMHNRYIFDEDIKETLWGYVEPTFKNKEYWRNKNGKI